MSSKYSYQKVFFAFNPSEKYAQKSNRESNWIQKGSNPHLFVLFWLGSWESNCWLSITTRSPEGKQGANNPPKHRSCIITYWYRSPIFFSVLYASCCSCSMTPQTEVQSQILRNLLAVSPPPCLSILPSTSPSPNLPILLIIDGQNLTPLGMVVAPNLNGIYFSYHRVIWILSVTIIS